MKKYLHNLPKSGLTKQVLIWFLCASLIPLCVISWISYQEAYGQLYQKAEQYLRVLAEIEAEHIKASFDRVIVTLEQESERQSNSQLLTRLENDFFESGLSADEFVTSYRWAQEVDDLAGAADLTSFWRETGYSDIYLIDSAGNILFSVSKGKDLGQNLFHGSLKQTRFSQAAKNSLTTGRISFSDLEFYAPKDNRLSGFLTSPIIDEMGDKIGLMAFALAGEQLQHLLAHEHSGDHTGDRYLLGADLTLRSPGIFEDKIPLLTQPVKTKMALLSQSEHVQHQGTSVEPKAESVLIYPDPLGKEVIGLHEEIEIAGIHWAYINEIPRTEALAAADQLARITLILVVITFFTMVVFAILATRRIVYPVVQIADALSHVGQGNLLQKVDVKASYELKDLVNGFNAMLRNLQLSKQNENDRQWLQDTTNRLNEKLQGDQSLAQMARNTISFLCQHLDVPAGAFYAVHNKRIQHIAGYACNENSESSAEFGLGEGLVGQAVVDKEILEIHDIPEKSLLISSGLFATPPGIITILPCSWDNEIHVVLEFATLKPFDLLQKTLFTSITPIIAISAQTALSRQQTFDLLTKTQEQAEELQAREEELRTNNNLLEEQAGALKASEEMLRQKQVELVEKNEKLQTQQEELRVSNEELESRALELKKSRDQIEVKNQELKQTQIDLEKQAQELTSSNQYKSEFLANMSHELRTPLNSMLILSKMLSENPGKNLSEKQVGFSQTIYEAGTDLLELINDILDLSKIEAGQMDVQIESVDLNELIAGFRNIFNPIAAEKGLEFIIQNEFTQNRLKTDEQKLSQIIKNLLSNAFKFTSEGSVKLHFTQPKKALTQTATGLTDDYLEISVQDTGTGIDDDKTQAIFEAFKQADGTTNRKYGGTGLGLSISRELTHLLGGEIHLQSQKGVGSTFSLCIPVGEQPESLPESMIYYVDTASGKLDQGSGAGPTQVAAKDMLSSKIDIENTDIPDDRHNLSKEDRSILIIEDDVRFAGILVEFVRNRGFKALVATDGQTGLYLADYYQPSGIMLDIKLPGIDGWQVMGQLKGGAKTRHIPVHFMSVDDYTGNAMKKGAAGYLVKPVSSAEMQQALERIEDIINRSMKQVLLIEDDPRQLAVLRELIGNGDVATLVAKNGAEALRLIEENKIDCIVLDYGLPDMSGLQLLERLRESKELRTIPVVVYTGKELDTKEREMLERYAQSLIIKSAHSEERLLDDTTLFLHRVEKNLPEEKQQVLRMLHNREAIFEGRKVLVVDDDMRNVYALSAILKDQNMQVVVAKNGVEALEKLDQQPDTSIVMMDIMMPEMDGYEACRRIRAQKRFSELPIIALTAKAMKGDRIKCIDAGASDYLAKPVDADKLLSMMRVWLYR